MRPIKAPLGAVLNINIKLLGAFLFAAVAWMAWPETAEGWRFAPLTIILAPAAIGLLAEGLSTMYKVFIREQEIAAFLAQGRQASSSELAAKDALKKADMTLD